MDTPITISSTLSSTEKSSRKKKLTQSDSSIARVPVSWDSPLKPCDRESACTPTTLLKVNNWINSLSRLNKGHVDSSNGSCRRSSDFSDYEMPNESNVGDQAGSIFVMANYNKSVKDRVVEDNSDNCCRNLYDYEKPHGSQSFPKHEKIYGGGPRKHFHPKASKRHKSSFNSEEKNVDKSDDYDSDEPLSPESEKKKELCSYLQLMKPTDKKTVMILQNRRSVRVKNLSLMQEKRDLEKKLKEAVTEDTNENGITENITRFEPNYPGLKSFEEMNVDLNKKKYKWLKYTSRKEAPSNSFCFPKPNDILKKSIKDFDEIETPWFEKRIEQASELEFNESNKLKLKEIYNTDTIEDISQSNESKENAIMKIKESNVCPESNNTKKVRKTKKAKRKFVALRKNTRLLRRHLNDKNIRNNDKSKTELKEESRNENNNANESKVEKEESRRVNKHHGRLNGNNIKKSGQQGSTLGNGEKFLIPRPPTQLVDDIHDFDAVIENNRDILNDNIVPTSAVKLKSPMELGSSESHEIINESKPPIKIENKGTKIKINTLKLNKDSKLKRKIINSETEDTKIKSRILNPPLSKESKLKQKRKTKRSISKHKLRRSSFKIKLKPKKKSLGLQPKSEQISLRRKSYLISDIMRSLRSQDVETSSVKNLTDTAPKKGRRMKKISNIKPEMKKIEEQKNQNPSECIEEPILKEPLKDMNRNSSENISPCIPLNEKSPIITEDDAKRLSGENVSTNSSMLQDLIHDVDFGNLSAEHKTSLFTTNVSQHDTPSQLPIIAIYNKETDMNGLQSISSFQNNLMRTKEKGEFYSQILNIEKCPEKDDQEDSRKPNQFIEESIREKSVEVDVRIHENLEDDPDVHNLRNINKGYLTPTSSKEKPESYTEKVDETSLSEPTPFIQFKKDVCVKSLHKCLNILTQKSVPANLEVENSPTSWPSESPTHKRKKSQYSINILKEHGSVLKAFYLEYNLVLCQEFMVSFWSQTALGNVLGAQNMWIHKGSVQRMAMNNNCIFKESLEMVVSTETNVAYIELWTKEHQSEIREGPVADVFATVYFWKKGQSGLDKKVLQLENINGFADDVQYSVLNSSPKIVVSWHLACSELESKKTFIHCYQLAHDYQSVCNISEYEAVEHYVSSLHNIEDLHQHAATHMAETAERSSNIDTEPKDESVIVPVSAEGRGCDNLIMGCGENKITLWNIEYGYIVATIEMTEIKSPLSTLWVKCDRGFLFTLQQCVDRELRLIAIHGMNHTWKKLASYVPPDEYDRLKGVCVENGIILAFYDQGIICWNAQTAETVVEEAHSEAEYISGKYVISVVNDQVYIRHAITHLLSVEDS